MPIDNSAAEVPGNIVAAEVVAGNVFELVAGNIVAGNVVGVIAGNVVGVVAGSVVGVVAGIVGVVAGIVVEVVAGSVVEVFAGSVVFVELVRSKGCESVSVGLVSLYPFVARTGGSVHPACFSCPRLPSGRVLGCLPARCSWRPPVLAVSGPAVCLHH